MKFRSAKFSEMAFVSVSIFSASGAVNAADTTPASQLQYWAQQANAPANAEQGKVFYNTRQKQDLSCATCHSANPLEPGKHSSTGKALKPLAPATNPKSLTDTAKIDKWFRRNCNEVVGRECSAQEKANVIAYLISLKP